MRLTVDGLSVAMGESNPGSRGIVLSHLRFSRSFRVWSREAFSLLRPFHRKRAMPWLTFENSCSLWSLSSCWRRLTFSWEARKTALQMSLDVRWSECLQNVLQNKTSIINVQSQMKPKIKANGNNVTIQTTFKESTMVLISGELVPNKSSFADYGIKT